MNHSHSLLLTIGKQEPLPDGKPLPALVTLLAEVQRSCRKWGMSTLQAREVCALGGNGDLLVTIEMQGVLREHAEEVAGVIRGVFQDHHVLLKKVLVLA